MPKRSNRLSLVVILCLALVLICVAVLFLWWRSGQHLEQQQKGGNPAQGQHALGTRPSDSLADHNESAPATKGLGSNWPKQLNSTQQTDKSSPISAPSAGPEGSSSSPSPSSGTETPVSSSGRRAQQLEEITQRAFGQHTPHCPEPMVAEHRDNNGCADAGGATVLSGPLDPLDALPPSDRLRPLEYRLNLSVPADHPLLLASLSILAETSAESRQLAVHCGRELAGEFPDREVRVWLCQSSSFLCVRSLTRLLDRQLLVLELAQPLPAGSLLRIHFQRIQHPLLQPKPALLVQIPTPWERDRAWMIGSQFPHADGGMRRMFPAVEDDDPPSRTVFRLCVNHSKESTARSNTVAESTREVSPLGMMETCFRETPPLPPSQFAFLLFRNLQSVPGGATKFGTELFIGGHLNSADYGWALEESERLMAIMRQLSTVDLPIQRLTLVSSPLGLGQDAIGGLGLAHIRESWIEYPKFVRTHWLLAGQIVRQWTDNMLLLCDRCLQQGQALYLEWLLGSELAPGDGEFQRRFEEARLHLLSQPIMPEKELAATATERCAERAAVILHSLDTTFGRNATAQFLGLLFRRHSWQSSCTPSSQLSQLYLEANGGETVAQQVFDSLLLPSVAATRPPLVRIRVRLQSSLVNFSQAPGQSRWIPLDLLDDTGKNTRFLLNQSESTFPLVVSSFVVAQPSTLARFLYNADNYLRLTDCLGQDSRGKCPTAVRSALQSTVLDLCWALLNQQLDVPAEEELHLWNETLRSLSASGSVQGDCACCMRHKTEALRGSCRWTWLDKCARIPLLNSLNWTK